MRSELLLEDCKETARRSDTVGAFADQFFGRLQKRRPEALPLLMDHDARTRAGHHFVENREWPGERVARISGRARPLGIQHQNSDARAVDSLPAVPCSCIQLQSPEVKDEAGWLRSAV